MTPTSPGKVEVGAIFDRLTVLSLDRVDQHWRKYWTCRCACGAEVSVRGDHLLRARSATRSCGCLNRELAAAKGRAQKGRTRWVKPVVGYRSAHQRVQLRRGRASEHACRCGAPAEDWAYDHADDAEASDDRGLVYSLDPEHYIAMCKRCHALFDYARRYAREAS